MILDKGPQFVVELTKKLNKIFGIETKLSILFYLQTDGQTKKINQELEQYSWFFVNHGQKNWPEWLVTADFVINNKRHLVTKLSLFMANYRRKRFRRKLEQY